MKVFKVLCVDVKTHLQVLAEDCSYNAACSWLDSQGLIDFNNAEIIPDYRTNRTIIIDNNTCFVYDENRGLLLGD